MIKRNTIFLLGMLLSLSIFAGGDDRDLGPVEVLDIIVEKENQKPKTKKTTTSNVDINVTDAIVNIKNNQIKAKEVVEVKKPVVEQKIIQEVKPVKREVTDNSFSDKPIGHPTDKVEDIAPKIYKTCEDMLKSDNILIKGSCAAILGTFIIL